MKILFIIAFIWIIYQIKKIFSDVRITSNKSKEIDAMIRKSGMDIKDADYEEIE